MTQPPTYTVNPHKLTQYLPYLLNGESYKLKTWLPNLIALKTGVSGTLERETYDHWLTQFNKKDPSQYNTKIVNIIQKIEQMRNSYNEVLTTIAELKIATDLFREKNRQQGF